MASKAAPAAPIEELLTHCSAIRRDVRNQAKLGRWRRVDLDRWEQKLKAAAQTIAENRPALEECGRFREAYRCIRTAQMRVAEARRHFGKIWALSNKPDIPLDSEEAEIALRSAAALQIGYDQARPVLRMVKAQLSNENYSKLRNEYIEASGDHYRLMLIKFGRLYGDASPETEADLRTWLLGDGGKSLTWAHVCRLDRRLGARLKSYPQTQTPIFDRVRAMALMETASTLQQHAIALDRAEAVRRRGPYHRGFEAHFKRFLDRYVYLVHTRGTEIGVQQPLEQEVFWKAYCENYEGMAILQQSSYWSHEEHKERRLRRLRAAASGQKIASVALVSNTPKFSYTLSDLFRENDFSFSFVPFDLVEHFYRERRIIDLLDEPPERLPNSAIRNDILKNPRFENLFQADAIVVDFANRAAAWASHIVRPHQKLFIRLHAYEAFSKWPYAIDWGAVDGLIYVSDAIKRLFEREMGDRIADVPSVTVPNFKRLPAPTADRRAGPHRRLGMLGAVIYRKQPVQALEILDRLQRRDSPEWELRLAGDYWPAETRSPETEHKAEFERLRAALPDPDRVRIDGFQTDIGAWFGEIDFLLSASLREGTHEAVNEAMHFGAVPVVRNWPLVAEFGGAECVYPPLKDEGLLYDTVDQAVDAILETRERYMEVSGRLSRFVATYLDNDRNFETVVNFMRQPGASR